METTQHAIASQRNGSVRNCKYDHCFNILNSISKDRNGNVIVFVSSLTSSESYPIHPHFIISNHYLKSQFKKSDLQIIKSIVISEGDIFISGKEYCVNNGFLFALYSIITAEKWNLPENQILNDQDILNRINRRFLNPSKELRYANNPN